MTTKHRATQYLEILLGGNSVEVEADLEFTFQPGEPEQGPSYASGGQPAEPAHVEDVWCKGIKFSGRDFLSILEMPVWLREWIAENADREALAESAVEDRKAERDAAADEWYERQRGGW